MLLCVNGSLRPKFPLKQTNSSTTSYNKIMGAEVLNNSLNIISFNMHGFNQGILQLKSLCDLYSIVMIQEHWCSSETISQFDYFNNNFYFFGISAMDTALSTKILQGRPWGGVGMLIRKSVPGVIKCISCTERI